MKYHDSRKCHGFVFVKTRDILCSLGMTLSPTHYASTVSNHSRSVEYRYVVTQVEAVSQVTQSGKPLSFCNDRSKFYCHVRAQVLKVHKAKTASTSIGAGVFFLFFLLGSFILPGISHITTGRPGGVSGYHGTWYRSVS